MGQTNSGSGVFQYADESHKISNRIKRVPCANNRILAMTLFSDIGSILMINTYFPNDTHSCTHIDPELNDVCDEIERLIYGSKEQFVILSGDINIDLKRKNAHSQFVRDFMERNKLLSIWQHVTPPDYTYHGPTGRSCIDHFII